MSLGMAIRGPEGLVLAAESRVTLLQKSSTGEVIQVNFDNATKLFSFTPPHNFIGVVTYGLATIGSRTASSFIPEFEAILPEQRHPISYYAEKLSEFFQELWKKTDHAADYRGPPMIFLVGGFDEGDPYGRVYLIDVPYNPKPKDQGALSPEQAQAGITKEQLRFGITWGGQREFVDRLLQGFDSSLPDKITTALSLDSQQQQKMREAIQPLSMPVPLDSMALQDCVDLALFFIRTTVNAQKLTVGIRGCGGPIDVATITRRDGFKYVQRKQISGEIA
jgi:hypothetical protein